MKRIVVILASSLAILPVCANSKPTTSQSETAITEFAEEDSATVNAPTKYDLYGLKSPVKEMKEWAISTTDLANASSLNPTDPSSVKRAIDEGILDEMSVHITSLKFGPDSDKTPTLAQLHQFPGSFTIKYKNGLPTIFILDEEAFQEAVDNGLFLDAYDLGFDIFTISYDAKGMPLSLSGNLMPYFGGRAYTETYSDYKFDNKGNWVSRKVKTPYDTKIQYRSYVY